jgi:hypothetical protein
MALPPWQSRIARVALAGEEGTHVGVIGRLHRLGAALRRDPALLE